MIVHYYQIYAPGGGGVLSIMHGLQKTGGPLYAEKRKLKGPGAYKSTQQFRRKMK